MPPPFFFLNIFDLQLVVSIDVDPIDTVGQLCGRQVHNGTVKVESLAGASWKDLACGRQGEP